MAAGERTGKKKGEDTKNMELICKRCNRGFALGWGNTEGLVVSCCPHCGAEIEVEL